MLNNVFHTFFLKTLTDELKWQFLTVFKWSERTHFCSYFNHQDLFFNNKKNKLPDIAWIFTKQKQRRPEGIIFVSR